MHLKLHKISKIFAKNGLPRDRTVKTTFREYFAYLVKLWVHSLIKMNLSPMRFYWLYLHSTILTNTSGRRRIDRTLVMTISTAGHCTCKKLCCSFLLNALLLRERKWFHGFCHPRASKNIGDVNLGLWLPNWTLGLKTIRSVAPNFSRFHKGLAGVGSINRNYTKRHRSLRSRYRSPLECHQRHVWIICAVFLVGQTELGELRKITRDMPHYVPGMTAHGRRG